MCNDVDLVYIFQFFSSHTDMMKEWQREAFCNVASWTDICLQWDSNLYDLVILSRKMLTAPPCKCLSICVWQIQMNTADWKDFASMLHQNNINAAQKVLPTYTLPDKKYSY